MTQDNKTEKHIIKEGSREHILRYDSKGVHCSTHNCEVNMDNKTDRIDDIFRDTFCIRCEDYCSNTCREYEEAKLDLKKLVDEIINEGFIDPTRVPSALQSEIRQKQRQRAREAGL